LNPRARNASSSAQPRQRRRALDDKEIQMKRVTIAGAVVLSVLSSVVLAQGTPAPTPPAQSPPAPTTPPAQPSGTQADTGSGGMRMGETATALVRFVSVKPADVTSSSLIGTTVYNNQNESIGEIEDLVIANGKTISGVVVSTGGFLGMGERYSLIEPSSIVLNQRDGKTRAFINTTKEDLKNAPPFNYEKKRS
jgi:sporulation protein YlmC with PRC-barrel domain